MDLIEDDPFDPLERLPELGSGQYEGETLRGGDEDVRGVTDHLLSLILRSVPGTDSDPDVRDVHTVLCGHLAHLGERCVEIAVDIVGEGLER